MEIWENIIDWAFSAMEKVGEFGSLLFTKMNDPYVLEVADRMDAIPGLDSSSMLKFFARLMPNFRFIDLLSITGIVILIVIYIVKKLDPFGG